MLSEDEYEVIQYQLFKYSYIIHVYTLVIGLMGNITACIVILCSRAFYNVTGFYLLSLTAADLLLLCTGVSFYVFAYKFEFVSHGKAARYIVEWSCQTSMIVSIWTVTGFTVKRHLAICHPFLVQSMSKKSRVKQIIISIWSTSALLALLPTAQVVIQNLAGNEYLKETNENIMPYIADFWATLCFFIPVSVIALMYVLIWLRLQKSSKGKQISRADTRLLMMFVIIVAAFLLSYGPFYIYRVLYTHMVVLKMSIVEMDDEFGSLVDNCYLVNLAKQTTYPLSSAFNPIIFSLMSKKFRDAFKDLSFKRIKSNTVETTS